MPRNKRSPIKIDNIFTRLDGKIGSGYEKVTPGGLTPGGRNIPYCAANLSVYYTRLNGKIRSGYEKSDRPSVSHISGMGTP